MLFGVFPDGSDWTIAVSYTHFGTLYLQFPATAEPVIAVEYTYEITVDDEITIIRDDSLFLPPLGNPPNVVTVNGQGQQTYQAQSGTISIDAVLPGSFLRGDSNSDGLVDTADAIWTLNELFQSGPSSPCIAATDANADGFVDASDATYLLSFRFLDGPPPPSPYPSCETGGPDCGQTAICEPWRHRYRVILSANSRGNSPESGDAQLDKVSAMAARSIKPSKRRSQCQRLQQSPTIPT